MKEIDLLTEKELPQGFTYPRQFKHILALGITDLQPWYILVGTSLREAYTGLTTRYPEQNLIPFARRQDNDDIACWTVGPSEAVLVIHDFASSGWERRAVFANFYGWFRQAVEDLIEFDC